MQIIKEKLLSRRVINDTTGCWEWIGTKTVAGYGVIVINKKRKYAHRIAHDVFITKVPEGMVVCHKCDNPSCVNPDHLFVGTQHENILDMRNKGRRIWKGTRVSKVTQETVALIDELRSAGESYIKIGKRIGLSKTQTRFIHLRRVPSLNVCR